MFYYFFRFSISLLSRLLLRCRVTGRENVPQHSACIVVANHVNLLDSPLLGVSLGRKVYFMAKEELFHSRFIGWLAVQSGAFPVAKGRLNRRAGRRALELLARGQTLIIFPEGGRSGDGKLGQAYPGAALLAVKSDVPIVPVGISGTGQLIGKRWFLRRPRITLNIGQPFTLSAVHDKLSKEETARLTFEIMTHIAGLLPPEYRGRYTN
ncbi:MAG: lysophospholipid acyltransferase family protein [Dehalococcoidales bacterium]|nr:lysophospholipid acyltransferase family protein [Dehalococcoidales bacterium]